MSGIPIEVNDLPAAYDPILCEPDTDAAAEACRLAALGAGEGTLVFVREQDSRPSRSGSADFSCALVLRPDDPREVALQLVCVAVVSLGAYIASEVPPLTALGYGSRNEVLLGGARLAQVAATPGPSVEDRYEWLVLGVSLNVGRVTDPAAAGETSLFAAGVDGAEPAKVLAGFARYFLFWVNRWTDEGFEPVRNAWRSRAHGAGEPEALSAPVSSRPCRLRAGSSPSSR